MPSPTNTEYLSIYDRVSRLEYLASPSLTYEEDFNTSDKLNYDRYSLIIEKLFGPVRVDGFVSSKVSTNINITPGTLLFNGFIIKETSTINLGAAGVTDKYIIVRVESSIQSLETSPGVIGRTIGSSVFSGPNRHSYSVSYLYQASIPPNTTSVFYLAIAQYISSTDKVTLLTPLISEKWEQKFVKLTDAPQVYTVGKSLRVNTTGDALEYFDAAVVGHNHNDLYNTKAEITTFLSGKADTSHNHDDLYNTKAEITTFLSGKADTSHNHNSDYYTKAEASALLSTKAPVSHTHPFNSLSGVPTSYTAGQYLKVNPEGTGLIYTQYPETNLVSLVDGPKNYEADGLGQFLPSLNAKRDGWIWERTKFLLGLDVKNPRTLVKKDGFLIKSDFFNTSVESFSGENGEDLALINLVPKINIGTVSPGGRLLVSGGKENTLVSSDYSFKISSLGLTYINTKKEVKSLSGIKPVSVVKQTSPGSTLRRIDSLSLLIDGGLIIRSDSQDLYMIGVTTSGTLKVTPLNSNDIVDYGTSDIVIGSGDLGTPPNNNL